MAVGTVKKFNQWESTISSNSTREWDDQTTGNLKYYLAKHTWLEDATAATIADIGANIITAGDGQVISADTPSIDAASLPGTTFYKAGDANFGLTVDISAKWLICTQPVVADTPAATDNLLWYVDLENTSTTAEAVASSNKFIIHQPANGWIGST